MAQCERLGLLFELFELRSKLLVRGEHFAQTHEGTYDIQADFDSAGNVQNGRCHKCAVFGERERRAAQPHFCARFGHHNL